MLMYHWHSKRYCFFKKCNRYTP